MELDALHSEAAAALTLAGGQQDVARKTGAQNGVLGPYCDKCLVRLHTNGNGSKPWYLVNIKIDGRWMFIHPNMAS